MIYLDTQMENVVPPYNSFDALLRMMLKSLKLNQ